MKKSRGWERAAPTVEPVGGKLIHVIQIIDFDT
jgi:hypothetical protein